MGLVINIDHKVRKGRDHLVMKITHRGEVLLLAVYLDDRKYLKMNFEGSKDFKIERLKNNDEKDIRTRDWQR